MGETQLGTCHWHLLQSKMFMFWPKLEVIFSHVQFTTKWLSWQFCLMHVFYSNYSWRLPYFFSNRTVKLIIFGIIRSKGGGV